MDVKAALGLADQVLLDPLRSEVKGLFHGLQASSVLLHLGDRITCVGNVFDVGSDWISVAALPFRPGQGFEMSCDQEMPLTIHMQEPAKRSICLSPGVQIVCTGLLQKQVFEKEIWIKDATISYRPELCTHMSWNAVHLFSGGFSGWSQALIEYVADTKP